MRSSKYSRKELVKKLNEIKELLIPPFEVRVTEKDSAWLHTELSKIPNYNKGVQRLPLDARFYVTGKETFDEIITWERTNIRQYQWDKFDCIELDIPLAWVFGLFFADGTCNLRHGKGLGGANWSIVNSNYDLLQRCTTTLNEHFPELRFEVKEYPYYDQGRWTNYGERKRKLYSAEVKVRKRGKGERGKGERGEFIKEFREMFYTPDGMKKVPSNIFGSHDLWIKRSFLEGVIEGDGYKKQHKIYTYGELLRIQLIKLLYDVGWKPTSWEDERGPHNFVIHFNWRHKEDAFILKFLEGKGSIPVKGIADAFFMKIWKAMKILNRLERVGYIRSKKPWSQRRNVELVKPWKTGCEDYSFYFKANVARIFSINQVAAVIDYSAGHGYNIIFYPDHEPLIFEPQNDSLFTFDERNKNLYKLENAFILI